jgi:hypothetical protein
MSREGMILEEIRDDEHPGDRRYRSIAQPHRDASLTISSTARPNGA